MQTYFFMKYRVYSEGVCRVLIEGGAFYKQEHARILAVFYLNFCHIIVVDDSKVSSLSDPFLKFREL